MVSAEVSKLEENLRMALAEAGMALAEGGGATNSPAPWKVEGEQGKGAIEAVGERKRT